MPRKKSQNPPAKKQEEKKPPALESTVHVGLSDERHAGVPQKDGSTLYRVKPNPTIRYRNGIGR
jgi:hypothetical protein